MEEWKDIEGYEGKYQVSSKGRVRSFKTVGENNIMSNKPHLLCVWNTGTYDNVTLFNNGKRKICTVHRLVAKAFVPNPENKPHINHKNGIKDDNRPENLEWCTHSENVKHSFDTGLQEKQQGERHGASKLTKNDVLDIRNAYKLGCFSHSELAEAYNISQSHITNIIKKRRWAHI